MNSHGILWVDNDPGQVDPYVRALRRLGFDVRVVDSPLAAERSMDESLPELVIIDVMMTTSSIEEELHYSPQETEGGMAAGLYFFRRLQARGNDRRPEVLVISQRPGEIKKRFVEAGLPAERYLLKLALEVNTVIEAVLEILGPARTGS